ncbi:hypothetical protein G3O06_01060 [Burkholderia sp. Ac-20345]|uniref:hypothetical protein n=1 Tax=Burkholderia sp. Ac-20345 TaxID=2703891 RepID=UPI00197B6FEE|nr:hypothetical protein [Burkholderia sp. Ac-20345]MBN3776155.1 hypothetical protein [Burkholderia sp. Ac-20345]
MNLRILKKLSKRAAPLLPLLGDEREQFRADDSCKSFTNVGGHDFKHWDRMSVPHGRRDRGSFKYQPKHGRNWIVMSEPWQPWKGTVMLGESVGYYEPEWEEHTAWEALQCAVIEHYTDWNEDGPIALRTFDTPSDYFRAAHEIIAAAARAQQQRAAADRERAVASPVGAGASVAREQVLI